MAEQILQSKLAHKTRELLIARQRNMTYALICESTGIGEAWLANFMNNPEREFGVAKVEALYEYLSGKVLDL